MGLGLDLRCASDMPYLCRQERAEPRVYRFFEDDRRDGTFAPFFRASLRPMAIACLRLLTLRPEPLLSVPFFRRRIADSTRFDADFPYFAMCHLTSGGCMDCSRDAAHDGSKDPPLQTIEEATATHNRRGVCQSSRVISTIVRRKPRRSKSRCAPSLYSAVHSTTRGAPC